ncbi:hypothetical protein MVEN_01829100 [Mycena venus]|uniref:Nephrocystin 3-like N-terminal domain-containing protein n=1 Tax=Mycena venus TaxID=2733690 RepID=A0A8H7CNE6_9AGAR|nr:hypothetical protein MVEN_01829100 [Mycena venus]
MPFTVNGNISGSTFNDVGGDLNQVTGNLTQIFTSHGDRPSHGVASHLALPATTDDRLIGVLETQRQTRNDNQPFDISHPSYQRDCQISQDAFLDSTVPQDGLGSPRSTMHPAILDDAIPSYLGDHRNVSVDTPMPTPSHKPTQTQNDFLIWPPRRESGSIPSNTYSIGGSMTQVRVISYGESGIDVLYRSMAMGAVHDSGEQFPEPACHPGTRVGILEQLSAWSCDASPESSILWLHGSAGMGKSAIAQAFAVACNNVDRLGASFFFKRGHSERRSWDRLISTIAYQLALSVPGLRAHIQRAVEVDKRIVSLGIKDQFLRLILEPLKQAPRPEKTPVLILDGLDECDDYNVQQGILRLFIDAIRVHQLPLRILVSSRPEPHIREVIRTNETLKVCRLLEVLADQTAYDDIRIYFRDGFSKIRSEFSDRGIMFAETWPPHEILEHLVKKSSGIFIYAATVIRFVSDRYSGALPQEQLDSVVALDPASTSPLDDLYTQILSSTKPKQKERQLRILHVIWQGHPSQQSFITHPEEIDALLNFAQGTSRLVLDSLHSLLVVPPVMTPVGLRRDLDVLHASFTDYLGDPRRSKEWCVSLPELNFDYLRCIIRLLSSPPTGSTRPFHSEMALALPKVLRNMTCSDELIGLLRNPILQHSLFLDVETDDKKKGPWPARGSPYPPDLIELWERHRFVSIFISHLTQLKPSGEEVCPTCTLDSVYREILLSSNTPRAGLLILLLVTWHMFPWNLLTMLRMLGLTYRIFEPFFAARGRLELPFPPGDSPIDFLEDPDRAGVLYMEPCIAAELLILQWIRHVKGFLAGSDYWVDANLLLGIKHCLPTPKLKVFDELATLDLSKICDRMVQDPYAHEACHQFVISDRHLWGVLDWLETFDEPPLEVIAFWEKQIADIQNCPWSYNGAVNGGSQK